MLFMKNHYFLFSCTYKVLISTFFLWTLRQFLPPNKFWRWVALLRRPHADSSEYPDLFLSFSTWTKATLFALMNNIFEVTCLFSFTFFDWKEINTSFSSRSDNFISRLQYMLFFDILNTSLSNVLSRCVVIYAIFMRWNTWNKQRGCLGEASLKN